MELAVDYSDSIVNSLINGKNVLLHAPGGTGKTFLLKNVAKKLTRQGFIVASCATTGIAAINLTTKEENYSAIGRTVHSWSGIGVNEFPREKKLSIIQNKPYLKTNWIKTDVLIIDEISMSGKTIIDLLNYIGCNIRRSNKPFGGIKVLFSGDFLQLPPVKDEWCFKSVVWEKLSLVPVVLENAYRYNDLTWYDMLLRIRKGKPLQSDIDTLVQKKLEYAKQKSDFGDDNTLIVKPTLLYSRKVDVDLENHLALKNLESKEVAFKSRDIFLLTGKNTNKEFYSRLLDDAIPEVITLKIGAQIMLKSNIDLYNGRANGSRGVITNITGSIITVKWVDGTTSQVNKCTWKFEDDNGSATREQVPFILAYASTIHKIQGLTLDYAVCNLGPSVFSAGQAYVALSRVRNMDGLFLEDFDPKSIKSDPEALKYVDSIEKVKLIK